MGGGVIQGVGGRGRKDLAVRGREKERGQEDNGEGR